MKRLAILTPIIAILCFMISLAGLGGVANPVHNSRASSQVSSQANSDCLIVHYKPGVSPERMQQIYQQAGATLEEDIPQIHVQVIKITSVNGLPAKNLDSFSEVDYVEPDSSAKAEEIPNDTDFNQQWGLPKIQAPQAWDITHSSRTIKIAILDSGIDSSHEDLVSKVVAKKNFSDSATTEDVYGHGTHVAGIAAAAANNNIGVAGVAYSASLMSVKVLNDKGGGSYSWIIQGIIWAADNGANVINLSMDGYIDSAAMKQAIDYAWNKGVVIIAAAGNNGNSSPTYPAAYDNCIGVAATDQHDRLYSFSDYGNWISVAAPGSAISTMVGNKYGIMSGTSMAAPFVSGLAGLAFAMARDTNGDGRQNDEVRAAIQNNCDNVGVSGIGGGRINAYKTISSLVPTPPLPLKTTISSP